MNFLEFITFFGGPLAIVMALGMLFYPLRFRNIILSIILFLLSYIHFFLYMIHTEIIFDFPHFFLTQIPVEMVIGPLLYFYVLSLTEDKQSMNRRDWLHFLPVIPLILMLIPYYLISTEGKRQLIKKVLDQDGYIFLHMIIVLGLISPIVYMFISIFRVRNRIEKGNPAYQKIIMLFSLLVIWLITGIIGVVGNILLFFPLLKIINVFITAVVLCFYFLGQRYPYLFQYATVPAKTKKHTYSKSHLDNLDLENLKRQLTMIIEHEKLYCDEDLSLSRLSDILEITTHQLSQFLNKHYNKNFNNFINSYRIREAREILVDDPSRNTLSVSFSVGFNSYSAFHSAFKREMGISPAEYRRKFSEKKLTES